jgi:hypothetical protein
MTATKDSLPKVRQRIPWISLSGILLIVFMTLGSAAANLLGGAPAEDPAMREEQRREEMGKALEERRARVDEMLLAGDKCQPAVAHELARSLVYDGRSAVAYADDYERRCGEDPIVRKWAEVSLKFPRTLQRASGAAAKK